MDEDTRCPECGYTDADARLHMDHHKCKNYPFFTQPCGYEAGLADCMSDVPTGQIPSAENLESFPPFSWKINDNCLKLTFGSFDTALSALFRLKNLRRTPVKAVAADTNEECETASQAHTGTKD